MGDIGEEQAPVRFEPLDRPERSAVVVDASALVYATTEADGSAVDVRRRLGDAFCHAPHLIDAELGNVLRKKVLRGDMSPEHAAVVLQAAPALIDLRHEHHGALGAAAWGLREHVTFYDGLYVALAAALDVVLLTSDKRLASAPNLPCAVDLVG